MPSLPSFLGYHLFRAFPLCRASFRRLGHPNRNRRTDSTIAIAIRLNSSRLGLCHWDPPHLSIARGTWSGDAVCERFDTNRRCFGGRQNTLACAPIAEPIWKRTCHLTSFTEVSLEGADFRHIPSGAWRGPLLNVLEDPLAIGRCPEKETVYTAVIENARSGAVTIGCGTRVDFQYPSCTTYLGRMRCDQSANARGSSPIGVPGSAPSPPRRYQLIDLGTAIGSPTRRRCSLPPSANCPISTLRSARGSLGNCSLGGAIKFVTPEGCRAVPLQANARYPKRMEEIVPTRSVKLTQQAAGLFVLWHAARTKLTVLGPSKLKASGT